MGGQTSCAAQLPASVGSCSSAGFGPQDMLPQSPPLGCRCDDTGFSIPDMATNTPLFCGVGWTVLPCGDDGVPLVGRALSKENGAKPFLPGALHCLMLGKGGERLAELHSGRHGLARENGMSFHMTSGLHEARVHFSNLSRIDPQVVAIGFLLRLSLDDIDAMEDGTVVLHCHCRLVARERNIPICGAKSWRPVPSLRSAVMLAALVRRPARHPDRGREYWRFEPMYARDLGFVSDFPEDDLKHILLNPPSEETPNRPLGGCWVPGAEDMGVLEDSAHVQDEGPEASALREEVVLRFVRQKLREERDLLQKSGQYELCASTDTDASEDDRSYGERAEDKPWDGYPLAEPPVPGMPAFKANCGAVRTGSAMPLSALATSAAERPHHRCSGCSVTRGQCSRCMPTKQPSIQAPVSIWECEDE